MHLAAFRLLAPARDGPLAPDADAPGGYRSGPGPFRDALVELYGDRLDRVVLFGARARGDARPDSDYDVAVFLKAMPDRLEEMNRLADLRVRFLDETDAFFDAKPFHAGDHLERTPLMHELRREGVDL